MKTYEKIYLILSQTNDFVSGEDLAKELKLSRTAIWKAIQALENQGLIIESVKNRGYRLVAGDLLSPAYLSEILSIPISLNPKSASTQLDAKLGIENQEVAPKLYLANSQTQAKGRFGRQFFANEQGGIYMSLRLTPNLPASELPAYTIMMASAIVKSIWSLTDKTPQIKWVNDIYLEEKKIAGILTEAITSIETGLVTDVIIGVGLNFAISEFPTEIVDKAGSLFENTPPTISRNDLIAKIWQIFFEAKEKDLIKVYKDFSMVLGREVTFTESGQDWQGQAIAITDKGGLIVKLPSGQEKEISSGEVSLTSW
ncbi:bifunctional biotin--[acetyl-CoA-carboxylase] ligase/biotin operon repressor BirA [Streptococcus caprae]|uniref:Bifunctional ligase/repressor BirA n=1 Tax=Streptococcus caprae TaxID=1640501 RepID=A0ABV8CY28_9STRE